MANVQRISLSPMDNVMPRFYARLIFAFRCSPGHSHTQIRDLLEQGLHQASTEIPSIAGKVYAKGATQDQKGALEIHVHRSWRPVVHLQDLEEELDYDELLDEGLPQDLLDADRLFPAIVWPDLEKGAPVFVAQANFVARGLLLAVGMYHSVIDGTSGVWLAKKWAEHTRLLQGSLNDGPLLEIVPGSSDPRVLETLWRAQGYTPLTAEELKNGEKGSDNLDLWRLLGLDPLNTTPSPSLTEEPTQSQGSRSVRSTVFYFSPHALEELKRVAAEKPGSGVSTNDALMALLWRAIVRSRFPDDDNYGPDTDEAVLDTTYDGRADFSPHLPFTYLGSLIFISTVRMQRSQLTAPKTSLASIAQEIRRAADKITPSSIRSAFGLAASVPDYTKLTFPFATFAGAEVCITSWIAWSLFDLDFGPMFANAGRPEFVRPPRREFDAVCRRCVVLPLQTHGGCEVLISLLSDEMQRLEKDEEFTRFASVVCH
ncbi:transferase family-domain-containing protein [Aspergillus granulosus]|uniref:Transferase family-domain-containing protein n=1 Tax=Aspergillus granulosus TaxID=176169 RepID=A0ABR4I4B6_9EURO